MRNPSILFPLALAALALGGCGKSAPEEPAAQADPAKAAAEMAFQFQPGKYRTTIEIEKYEVPGMPAAVAAQMKTAMTRSINREHCITAEQAAKGVEAMKEHMGEGKCRFEKFEARGGTVDSVFACQTGQDMSLRSTSHGTYTPTGSKLATKAEMNGPGGSMVRIEQTMTTVRIGDCGSAG